MTNKNSTYIGALTSFILDTKPFHAKLTEVQEIYHFSDEMHVHFDERLFSAVMTKAAWMYTYFSGGVSESMPGIGQPMELHELISPLVRGHTRNSDPLNCRGAFKAFRDENLDLPLVPFAFDPHQIQGAGLRDAFVQRNGSINLNEPILEGHDVFLSKGAFVFQIKQAVNTQPPVIGRYTKEWTVTDGPFPVTVEMPFTNADSLIINGPGTQLSLTTVSITGPGVIKVTGMSNSLNYEPLYTARHKENTLAIATSTVQGLALDLENPNSAVNKIKAIINAIDTKLGLYPNANASAELAIHEVALNIPILPSSYEELLLALVQAGTPIISGFTGWIGEDTNTETYVSTAFSSLSSGLYSNLYTDVANRESGALQYSNTAQHGVTVSSIHCDPFREAYEEWTLTATTSKTLLIKGSSSGPIGTIELPSGAFNSPYLGFTFSGPETLTPGVQITLTPVADVTVHYQAPLETWSLIKTNPIAYSRPVFKSTRYGFIRSGDLVPVLNAITILDTGLSSGSLVLTAISATTFKISLTTEPLYTGTAEVNTVFNDGRIAFTIVNGAAYSFTVGDKFFIEIENPEPMAEDLGLYYGYDFDSYDANTMVYNTIDSLLADYLKTIDFGFDSRFIGYDLPSFGLTLAADVIPDIQWRLRAIPNLAMPLNLHPINAPAAAINEVSVIATNDPTNPLAILQVDMDPPADIAGRLLLYYATSFELERYNEDTLSWASIDTISINAPYSNPVHGLSFTIVQADKPFIAATLNLNGVTASETSGDVIAWTIRNAPPYQLEPANLVSARTPRLVMYGDSYHFALPASWSILYTAQNQYVLQGTHVGGVQHGTTIFNAPIVVNTTNTGHSYKNDDVGLHFTIMPGVVGLSANDSFTFNTFANKPSYLVHGSVSGWQPNATVNEWYWNGKIGFKIPEAKVRLFNSAGMQEIPWITEYGLITVNRLRCDTPSSTYRVVSHADGHWTFYRNGALVGDGDTLVSDQFLSVSMPSAPVGTSYILYIQGQELPLTMGHDLAIIRTSQGRMPTANDFVLLERTKNDTICISIKPKDAAHTIALSPLALAGIIEQNVNLYTNGVPLEVTSPETAVLQGWIPLLETRYDRGLSIAEFSDPQMNVVVRAAATGETIGEVLSLGESPLARTIFRWNPEFHEKYLPLNAGASVVTLGSGMNDRMNVSLTDTVMFLMSSGGLLNDVLFADNMAVQIAEASRFSILANYTESPNILIADGPFDGFMPGYDNTQFDNEASPDGYYDANVPLTDWFQQAQGLSLLPTLTAPQQALLNDLTSLLSPWIEGNILTTTFAEFVANIGANPPTTPLHNNPVNWTPTSYGFGIPAVGMGMQVETGPSTSASASIREAAAIILSDFGYSFNHFEYNIGQMDEHPEQTVILFTPANPPIPSTGLSGLTTYEALQTPFTVPSPGARVIELLFSAPILSAPTIYVWWPNEPAPTPVPIIERLSARTFRFSLPVASELKVIVI